MTRSTIELKEGCIPGIVNTHIELGRLLIAFKGLIIINETGLNCFLSILTFKRFSGSAFEKYIGS